MNNKIYVLTPILAAGFLISGVLLYAGNLSTPLLNIEKLRAGSISKLQAQIIPSRGVSLPVIWGGLGTEMIKSGIIDAEKFESLYVGRGGLDDKMKKILYGTDNKELIITKENAGFLLNVLWALGLGNKNEILEKGPMSDPRYGGAGRFASTGGWTLADGNVMNHYSQHKFISLTSDQQKLVEKIAKNIYRPCCNNATYFPDCNHGMAMLGFIELMASQGANEADMYKAALVVNSYWFPDTYVAIAQFLNMKGFDWRKAESKDLLNANFSSASGYQQIVSELKPANQGGGGSCGV